MMLSYLEPVKIHATIVYREGRILQLFTSKADGPGSHGRVKTISNEAMQDAFCRGTGWKYCAMEDFHSLTQN